MPVPPPVAAFPTGSPVVTFNDDKTVVTINAFANCPDASYWDSLPAGRIEIVLTVPGLLPGDSDRQMPFSFPTAGSTATVSVDQIQAEGGGAMYKASSTISLGVAGVPPPINDLTVKMGFIGRHNNSDTSCWTDLYDSSQSHG